jgi:sulfoxide reductase heme-binding subunit YedZ
MAPLASPVVAAASADERKAGPSPWPPRLALLAALAPVGWLGGRALLGDLGANPVEEVLNRLGLHAIAFLLASLACTPLQRLLGWSWALRVRKTLGLAAFFWALAHVLFYVGIDQGLDLRGLWDDVVKHRFIFLGMAALLLLFPLAVTSTKAMERRLGFRRWKRLHRLSYAAGALACAHFYLRFKLPEAWPIAAAALLALLLAARLWTPSAPGKRPATPRAAHPGEAA